MKAGTLDRRVRVEFKAVSQSAGGEEVETWSELYTLWMGKRDARASERLAGDQVVAEVDAVFWARWNPALVDIRPDMHRLVYRGRVYNILGAVEIGRQDGVEFACAARGEAKFGD